MKRKLFTPWSSLDNMMGRPPVWWPEEERERIQSYEKYDQMFWNDPTQYAIRVLEDEQPLYIPNARIIVETTAQYLMKGLRIMAERAGGDDESPLQKRLDDLLRRETFYSKFHVNKQAGITRGDWAFHVTADPTKPPGRRVSIDDLHPGMVYRVSDPDDPTKTLRVHIFEMYVVPNDPEKKERVRRLTYEKVVVDGRRRIKRQEAVYELYPEWWGPAPKFVRWILEPNLLPPEIDQIPVYWFKNIDWQSQDYGSSELRGLEFLQWASSQGATDTQMALALEGLGVYATDGGHPVDDRGREVPWEVAPGKVMEVPSGSFFRRVEGVGTITPMMDQLRYLEGKMFTASGMTDVALGQVDVQVAQSGLALAIKFMPTMARIEHRDTAGVELLHQMWFDLSSWYSAYEGDHLPEVLVHIASSKLPVNSIEVLNQLNNMLDRRVISRKFYRDQAKLLLGYNIPDNEEIQIQKEQEEDARIARMRMGTSDEDSSAGSSSDSDPNDEREEDVDRTSNQSNNRTRPNESSGTEATQTPESQARN